MDASRFYILQYIFDFDLSSVIVIKVVGYFPERLHRTKERTDDASFFWYKIYVSLPTVRIRPYSTVHFEGPSRVI